MCNNMIADLRLCVCCQKPIMKCYYLKSTHVAAIPEVKGNGVEFVDVVRLAHGEALLLQVRPHHVQRNYCLACRSTQLSIWQMHG